MGAATYQTPGTWTAAVGYRWQKSDRHFIGDEEQVEREKEGSQVINDIHLIDVSVAYAITKRITATLGVPFQIATRSQAVRDPRIINEFGNGTPIDRYETSASGLSDIRLLGTIWLLDPDTFKKGNVSIGLGVVFPTGEKDVKDVTKVFATDAAGNYSPRAETRNVDNSIQPGAGVWGIIFDIYGFAEVAPNLNLFAAATYISTPETDAGVISGSLTAANPTIWSAGDSYLFRLGGGYTFHPGVVDSLTFTLGGRMEGTPSEDLIGSSAGRRRPGFAISIEPGLVVTMQQWFASFSAPVAVYRNRERNFEGDAGDAAFADFMTLFTLGRVF